MPKSRKRKTKGSDNKRKERRKSIRTHHVINDSTSYRDELLARVELASFFLKRY